MKTTDTPSTTDADTQLLPTHATVPDIQDTLHAIVMPDAASIQKQGIFNPIALACLMDF